MKFDYEMSGLRRSLASIPIPGNGEGQDVLSPDLADDATYLPSRAAALLVCARPAPRLVDGRAASIADKQEERNETAGPEGQDGDGGRRY